MCILEAVQGFDVDMVCLAASVTEASQPDEPMPRLSMVVAVVLRLLCFCRSRCAKLQWRREWLAARTVVSKMHWRVQR